MKDAWPLKPERDEYGEVHFAAFFRKSHCCGGLPNRKPAAYCFRLRSVCSRSCLGGWRGKCHASGRRNELGGAATTPGSCRQGEPQSAGNNQIHPAREAAKSKFSYSFRSFSGFQKGELRSFPCVYSSSNATESLHDSPNSWPLHSRRPLRRISAEFQWTTP